MIRQGKAEVLFPLDVVLLLHCCFALCFLPSRWESRSLHSHVIEYVLVAKYQTAVGLNLSLRWLVLC